MARLLALLLGSATGLLLVSGHAWASCDPAAGNNVTATCTGSTTVGYGDLSFINLSVTVVPGASVAQLGPLPSIVFDTGNVVNYGHINIQSSDYLYSIYAGTNATVTNTGTGDFSTGLGEAIIAGAISIYAGNDASVTNSNIIRAPRKIARSSNLCESRV